MIRELVEQTKSTTWRAPKGLSDPVIHFVGSLRTDILATLNQRRLHSALGYHSPMAFKHLPAAT